MAEIIETLIVTFFETPVLAARTRDGTIRLAVRDLCAAVGLDRASQVERIRDDEDLRDGLETLRVDTAGGPQATEFLVLEFVPAWISTVNRRRASAVVRERLRYLRLFSIRQVYDAVAQASGLPTGSSRHIEELSDLERFDVGIQGLAERQQAIEESQNRARLAWQDHERRLREVEERLRRLDQLLTREQRGTIYQLVHAWGRARAEREGKDVGAAIAGCWGIIKTRYRVAKYEHILAEQYDDCVRFIHQQYERLTGQRLDDEQLRMDLDVEG